MTITKLLEGKEEEEDRGEGRGGIASGGRKGGVGRKI